MSITEYSVTVQTRKLSEFIPFPCRNTTIFAHINCKGSKGAIVNRAWDSSNERSNKTT